MKSNLEELLEGEYSPPVVSKPETKSKAHQSDLIDFSSTTTTTAKTVLPPNESLKEQTPSKQTNLNNNNNTNTLSSTNEHNLKVSKEPVPSKSTPTSTSTSTSTPTPAQPPSTTPLKSSISNSKNNVSNDSLKEAEVKTKNAHKSF